MTETERYDAIVVGTGQAGKPLARSLAKASLKTAIIERDERVGGTCVLYGCTPTKTMVASARVAYLARRAADYGVNVSNVDVDLAKVRERKRAIVEMFSSGSQKGLERTDGLDLIFGEARFAGPEEIEVGERRLSAPKIFLNTGTRPWVPPIDGIEAVPYLTSGTIMELDRVPEHLVIVGGGYIGLEFGQMFRRFGSDVTILQRGNRLLPREDEDVSDAMLELLREDGVNVQCSATTTRIAESASGRIALTVDTSNDGSQTIEASALLLAAGRTPNSDMLRLDAVGITPTDRGYIPVNERLETSADGIWALGDVNGGPAFTHISYDDYRIVEANVLRGESRTTEGRLVPYSLFTDPELGRIGLTEREARDRGLDIDVAKIPMKHVARAIESDETRGFMKAIVDKSSRKILGASILGINGGEVMSVLQVAMMGELAYTAIRNSPFAHPTLAESLNNLFMRLER